MRRVDGTGWLRAVSGVGIVAGTLVLAGGLCGCLVAGVSSGGGWFIWPGGFGLVVLILVILFFLRRRG
jgi:hypothetical protein